MIIKIGIHLTQEYNMFASKITHVGKIPGALFNVDGNTAFKCQKQPSSTTLLVNMISRGPVAITVSNVYYNLCYVPVRVQVRHYALKHDVYRPRRVHNNIIMPKTKCT